MTLTDVLNAVHKPTCIESAWEALGVMQRIALISAADTLIEKAITAKIGRNSKPIFGWPTERLLQNVPFSITGEQLGIVERQINALSHGKLLNLLLIGDVGTGKTVVYGMIAGYVCSAKRRICVVLPNGRLAEQIHEELTAYFPEFSPLLVNSESKYTGKQMQACSMLIGTSALMFREVGEFDLVVIDEQQKLSLAQRTQLVGSNTSVIEVSATPIPRTVALAQYGAVNIEFIKHCHVEKSIETIILERQHIDYMDSLVLDTVRSGYKVLIVCPKRDGMTDNDIPDTETVAAYYEKMMPGQVSMAHSGLTDEENTKALSDIKEGITSVLVSTVIVEVGLTIPKLVLGIVMRAERFGLSQLHQIRGRLSRSGGYGLFCLYLPKALKAQKSVERMIALTEITCGHELALRDLKLRGVGDLEDGTTQHGAYHGHIRNLHVDIGELEEFIASFSI